MIRSCAILAVVGLASVAAGQVINLGDGNSTASFNITGGNQIAWSVDNVSQLFNQRFFYRVGAVDEVPVDSLPLGGVFSVDANPFDDARPDTLTTRYTDNASNIRFQFRFSLDGGLPGSGTSDLAEQIEISNLGNTPVTLSFFQYVDFDLGGTAGGDLGWITGGRVAHQADIAGGFTVAEAVVTPAPNHFEVNNYPNIVARFGNGVADTLTDAAGPVAGDVTWAFQWDITIGGSSTFTISKDKLISVPTPGAVGLIALGGLVTGRRRRR